MPTAPETRPDIRENSVKRFQLLCVAHRSDVGGWEAFCLDFDIAVHARTFDEAKAALQTAVLSYTEDAMQEDEPARSQLLNRRAPLHVRLMWGWRLFVNAIRDRRDQNDNVTIGFPVSCPA